MWEPLSRYACMPPRSGRGSGSGSCWRWSGSGRPGASASWFDRSGRGGGCGAAGGGGGAKRRGGWGGGKGGRFGTIFGEFGFGEVGGGGKKPSLIRFGRLLFIVVWFPINMVLWFIDFFVLAILQFLANVACFLLGQPVLVQERMVVHMKARMQKRLNLMTVFLILIVFPILAIMMPINFVLSGIYVTLRILQAIVGYCRLLLREIPKNLKIINEKGVVAYLKYLRWFYVNMARAFVPMVKDAWQQSFGKGISRT